MKRIVFFVTLALAGSAWAQAEKPAAEAPAAVEKASPKAAGNAAAKAAKPAAAKVAKPAGDRKSRRQQDARHCLERPTNDDVIKCAEAYL